MGRERWTAEEDTKLVRATRRLLARTGCVLPKESSHEWAKTKRKLDIDRPERTLIVHYNWICWVHKWGLDRELFQGFTPNAP